MDFTLDDASTALQYSDGWDVQGSNDSLVAEFFESTYHATVIGGASVNLTFVGTGISLYGSKGPRHAQFTVYFDGVAEVLNAQAPRTAFRQLLFQTTFANSTSSTEHLLSVVVQPLNNQTWFDLDYVSFSTADAGSAPPASSPTLGLTPPWASYVLRPPPASTLRSTLSPRPGRRQRRTSWVAVRACKRPLFQILIK
ncbi:hypothetical protein OF83DRAFT_581251 [Amylostereum chailletii]|nr:hypothetical protein OF83DRAFT_581251 [Amylostereum chailletii]